MPHHCPDPVPTSPKPLSSPDPFLAQRWSSLKAGAAATHEGAPSSTHTPPPIPEVPTPHPAAHATQPLWKSRDWGALQRSDAAALPWRRVTSCLGAQGRGSPGAHGGTSAPGCHGHVCGCRDRAHGVGVGVPVHPARVDPTPGLGKGMWGPCMEGEPPRTLTQPCCHPARIPTHTRSCGTGQQPLRSGGGRGGSR